MATYLIKKEYDITRQEGDTADVVIVVPDVIDMQNYDVQFSVKSNMGVTIFDKKTADGTITVAGQTITIPLLATDTKDNPGKYRWELQISNNTPEVITIGRGVFLIVRELIK